MKKKKKLLPTSLIVTQSNQLVQARYNLPLAEQRLVLTMISKIQPDDEDFKPYRISVGELAEFLGVDKGSAYRECKRITESLLQRVVSINEPDGLLQIGWVSSAKYIDGAGMVNLSFDPLLKPYLLQIKSNFTSCKLGILLRFKSQYSVRIYTLLKQYEYLKEREIELQVLREMLGIGNNQYKLYADFKRHVLLAIQKELKEKADIYFDFDETKYGRQVGAIRFRIFVKKADAVAEDKKNNDSLLESPKPVNENASLLDSLLLLVPEQHRAKKTILSVLQTFINKAGPDYVRRNILYSNAKADKSYAGFLNSALKEDWGNDWELDLQIVSVKKKPLEIWERNGFSSQKEYDDHMYRKQMEQYKKT